MNYFWFNMINSMAKKYDGVITVRTVSSAADAFFPQTPTSSAPESRFSGCNTATSGAGMQKKPATKQPVRAVKKHTMKATKTMKAKK